MRMIVLVGVLCTAGLSASVATGQQAPGAAQTENRGLRHEALPTLDLAGQIDGMQGRQFRLRRLTMEPGGHAGMHEHRDRPALIYIVEGAVTDHREGGEPREYRAGQSITETVDTRHWIEKRGNAPTVLVVVDLFKP